MEKDTNDAINNVVEVDFNRRKIVKKNQDDIQECLNEKKNDLFARWLTAGTVCVL
jgi:hypothetical protein